MAASTADEEAHARVFISYSRRDAADAEALAAALRDHGYDAFLDKTDIAPGEPWRDRLGALIEAADTVVFMLSPHSAASAVCQWEVEESERLGKRILPWVAAAVPPDSTPAALARLNWIFGDTPDRFAPALVALRGAIETDLVWTREHTRLGELARRWEESGRAGARLLRGGDLDAAERWLAAPPANAAALPTTRQRGFIRAGRSAATARLRGLVAVAITVAVLAIGLAAWALLERRSAVLARNEAEEQRNVAVTAREEADRQRSEAERQRNEAVAQRDRADRNLTTATETARRTVTDLAIRFREAQGIGTDVQEAVLGAAYGLLEQLDSFNTPTPASLRGRVLALGQMAITLARAGSPRAPDLARTAYRIASDLLRSTPNEADANDDFASAAEAMVFAADGGDPAAGLGHLREATQSYGRCYELRPDRTDCLVNAINAQGWMANLLLGQKHVDEAIAGYLAAIDLTAKLEQLDDPGSKASAVRQRAQLRFQLGRAYVEQGRIELGLSTLQQSATEFERMANAPNASTQDIMALGNIYNSMAVAIRAQAGGHVDPATATRMVELFLKARQAIERIVLADPRNVYWLRNLANLDRNIATAFGLAGNPTSAAEYDRRADAEEQQINRNARNGGG